MTNKRAQRKAEKLVEWFLTQIPEGEGWWIYIGGPIANALTDKKAAVAFCETELLILDGQFVHAMKGTVLVHGGLCEHFPYKEMQACILHEIGHLLYGKSERDADQHVVDSGMGNEMADFLDRLFTIVPIDMAVYEKDYGIHEVRIAHLRGGKS